MYIRYKKKKGKKKNLQRNSSFSIILCINKSSDKSLDQTNDETILISKKKIAYFANRFTGILPSI